MLLPSMFGSNPKDFYKILIVFSPFTPVYTFYFTKQVLFDIFCIQIFSLSSIGKTTKPSFYIFRYLELFFFDGYCMPYFDNYLVKERPELAEISERIMKLAIYYDYSSRFEGKLGKIPRETSEEIHSMIKGMTKNSIYKTDECLWDELENGNIETNHMDNIALNETTSNNQSESMPNSNESPVHLDFTNSLFNNNIPDSVISEYEDTDSGYFLECKDSSKVVSKENTVGFPQISDQYTFTGAKKNEQEKLYVSKNRMNLTQSNESMNNHSFKTVRNEFNNLVNNVKINIDISSMEFHQPENCRDLLIMKDLNKLKDAFEDYKKTKSFMFLFKKIEAFEYITTYVYGVALTDSEKKVTK